MKLPSLLLLFLGLASSGLWAQTYTFSGSITDADNGETLIGATVSADGTGVTTDFDGNFSLELPAGDHVITFSYVGYTPEEFLIKLNGDLDRDILLRPETNVLDEVVVTSDIAIERETPVAFSNIPTAQLDEELAAQDLPMVLNSTPGAYATQSGGGDGDARISIRGFDQRNVAVMLDGIPVNDMENGRVFWSNWFGLDLVTQTMQVQRGLGASKLSVPSVGGTINILTKGIDAKRGLRFRQELGNNGFTRSTLGLTSGRLKSGWGFSLAGSYKRGDGWVDGNFTEGYFYYLRIDKELGDHVLSFQGFGAPQEHGQRSFTAEIGQVDTAFALEVGVPQEAIGALLVKNKGRRYNEHWGCANGRDENGDCIGGEILNSRRNFYHKPQFSLRHSWQPSDRIFWSNVAYLSIGNGGGTAPDGSGIPFDDQDQRDFQAARDANVPTFFNPSGLSNGILRASINNHFWYGVLSTVNYNIRNDLTLSAGIDGRYYRGEHYREVHDLLGGTGFTLDSLQVGDRFDYDYTGFVRWLGGFALLEYKQGPWSTFVNFSRATSDYRFVNNFTGLEIDWVNVPTTTVKAGAKYNINRRHGVFANAGWLDKAQRYSNVIITNFWTNDADGRIANNFENENIQAIELGYNYKSPTLAVNVNGYYTIWGNKPLDRLPTVAEDPNDPDSDRIPVNIPGVDALHRGIEIDFAYRPFKNLTIEGLASVGDWIWNSGDTVEVVLPNQVYSYDFDATGVHVGDAAQLQFGGLVRYSPIKGSYIKLRATYFGRNFANFDPESLRGPDVRRDSWQMPDYTLFDLHLGYRFKVRGVQLALRASIINLFDTIYISDARNNDDFNSPAFSDFDAKSASVFVGQGRRGTVTLQIDLQ